jgi:hypothetical protein
MAKTPSDLIERGSSGEANTNTNVGTGAFVAKTKIGVDTPLRSLRAGDNVTIIENPDDITISASLVGVGEENTATNVGTGEGTIVKAKVGVDIPVKTLKAGTGVTIINNTDDITIEATGTGEANTNTNVGTGEGTIAKIKVGLDTPLKTLKAGTGVFIVNNTDDITISAPHTAPGGSDSQIQFNESGGFGSAPELTWDNVKKDLNINGVKINGLSVPTVLADNTTSITPVISRSLADYKFMVIEYSIIRGTASRNGTIKTTHNGVDADISDLYSEVGSTGITFYGNVSGTVLDVSYTSTNTGISAEFKYFITYWS